MQKSLLLGGGRDWRKQVRMASQPLEWSGDLTVLDMNPNAECMHGTPGTLMALDLEERPLPFHDDEFDEMGAYDVLEHIGVQGDWRGWFAEMAEYHRLLKPGGLFGILVPIGEDALADPGHTRFFQANWFGFCSRKFYEHQSANMTKATDYRWYLDMRHPSLNFDVVDVSEHGGHHLAIMLKAVKA